MKSIPKIPLWMPALILLTWGASNATGSSLTLDSTMLPIYLTSGSPVTSVPPKSAGFVYFDWWDKNDDGVWNGPDARRQATATYANGLFGLYSKCETLGGYAARHEVVGSHGLLIIDDLIITTTDPTPPATIQTSVNFHVSGSTSHFTYVAKGEVLTATLDMGVHLAGTVFNGEYAWSEYRTVEEGSITGLGTQIAGGSFSDSFSSTITTGLANVPVNTPFSLRIDFTVSAGAGGGASGSYGGVTFDATNTAGFLPGAAILNNIPAGYTVSSAELNIVNNAFQAAPVPVEATTWGNIKRRFGN